MKSKDIDKEIENTKEMITKLEEIKENTEKGLEINKFVLGKLEEWKLTLQ